MYRLLSSRLGTTRGASSATSATSGASCKSRDTTSSSAATAGDSANSSGVTPSAFIAKSCLTRLLSVEQFGCTHGEVGQDAIGTGTFEGHQGFEDDVLAQPAVLDRRHMHGVLAADLIDEGRRAELQLHPPQHVQIR